ncbi:hypothetical protein V502_00493 [Pseudogymnoascus sp. VKM F-4520 (FW-2644)]|nr:hypothetical protein V502_00493 [Pseudogymnoascus sp. VKM F-4520 (FW-2644)]
MNYLIVLLCICGFSSAAPALVSAGIHGRDCRTTTVYVTVSVVSAASQSDSTTTILSSGIESPSTVTTRTTQSFTRTCQPVNTDFTSAETTVTKSTTKITCTRTKSGENAPTTPDAPVPTMTPTPGTTTASATSTVVSETSLQTVTTVTIWVYPVKGTSTEVTSRT